MMLAAFSIGLVLSAALASTVIPAESARNVDRRLLIGALLLLPAGWKVALTLAPLIWLGQVALSAVAERKRREAVRDALPDDLKAISASMRGGRAMVDAIQGAASVWLRGAAAAVEAGSPPGASLRQSGIAAGIPDSDLGWTSTLDELSRREVPLVAFLDATAARLSLRREARSNLRVATSQARGQAMLLTAIPPLLVLIYFFVDSGFRDRAPASPVFWGILAMLALLDSLAWLWIRSLLVPPR